MNMDFKLQKKLVKRAMKEAEKAIKKWNSPFGAIITDANGNIIIKAYNTVNSDMNPTAHAEINAIKKACKKLASKNLSAYYLISNAESCPMCMTAAIKAKITHFIFGAPTERDSDPYITVHNIAKHSKQELTIQTGVLGKECSEQIAAARNW